MVKLTITVSDIDSVIALYNQIKIYRAESETGTYSYLGFVTLVAGVSTYYYYDTTGTSGLWYKSSYYNSINHLESSLSSAAQGMSPSLYHNITYPEEYVFDDANIVIIRKIRRLIGDLKELNRIYSDGTESCSYVMDDAHTIDMQEKGWPVYISINGTEYTSSTEPYVQGYQYLTFSGTLDGDSDVIDVWFYTFSFSDVEIYRAYDEAMIPPLVPADCVSSDHLMLQAAIDLLESMTARDMVNDGSLIRNDMTVYDPTPGLRERSNLIRRLRKQLDALIKECLKSSMLGLEGVLID